MSIARSPLMQAVFRDASLIAPSETRVLITGESGVGKEVVADVIHAWSSRAAGPLVKVNCAAIPETLLEAELFGHEKGAFTGAHAQRIGRFEEANDGTIFLDEVAEMSPALQAKLLRVTQDGRFQRVGSNREIHTNARILAASNRNLEDEVKNGRFREDLFYRLNVVELNIPPLRERREDILPLAGRFIEEIDQRPRAVFGHGGRVSGALSVAGQRARVAQRDGAGGAAFPQRIDSAGTSAHPRPRRRGATCRRLNPPTWNGWRKSNARPSCRRCVSMISTAPKRPGRWASAAARCFTNCNDFENWDTRWNEKPRYYASWNSGILLTQSQPERIWAGVFCFHVANPGSAPERVNFVLRELHRRPHTANKIGRFGGLGGILRRVPGKKQAAPGVIYRCGCFTTWNRDWWLRSQSRTFQAGGQIKDIKNIFTGCILNFLWTVAVWWVGTTEITPRPRNGFRSSPTTSPSAAP